MSGELPAVFVRYFVEYYFKEGLPYDEKMQSKRSPIHQPQSPSALSALLHIDYGLYVNYRLLRNYERRK